MPNKLVQAATEGLPSLTRRLFLGGAAVASLPVAAASVILSRPEPTSSVDDFLAKALPAERIRYHSNALAEAMAEMHPERMGWRVHTDHTEPFVLVVPSPNPGRRFMDTGREV
ncbi:hypothetical protein [Rhizobium leguminosarum]|uniref:Uncharacterized protein n=1 Tax=Rhizobium leguminosarum TaxID=384 RepID=A0A7K3VEX0_RHILE|nr:hypothetical protein [Rhizobium leguminosarum]NEK15710.1 hypothetical protein [Rhizobium leguminosarum]